MSDFNEFELHSPDSMFQEGLDLLESDHFEEALNAFNFVVEHQPYNADALFHRGVALVNLSRVDEAIVSFEDAIELAPTEPLFHSHYGYALMIGGKSEAALEHFNYALELQPDSNQIKVYKACALAERRQFGDAKALLEDVLNVNPDETEALRHYGNILMVLGEDEKALEQFSRILRRNPNHLESISRRGAIFLRRGERLEAVKCMREYLALASHDHRAWTMLLETLTELGNHLAVIAAATEAIDCAAELPEIYMYRGQALLEQRQFDAAVTDLRRARTLNDRIPEIHLLLARAFAERGRTKYALISVNRALQLDPRDRNARLLKASLHRELEEHAEELEQLSSLLDEIPTDYRLMKLTAECQSTLGKHTEACMTVDAFLQASPRHRRALLLSARLHEQAGNIPLARRRFREVFSQTTVTSKAVVAYTSFLIRQVEIHDAAKVLERGVAEHPNDTSLHGYRAVVLQMLNEHRACIDALRAFISTGHASPEIHWLLGKSQYAMHEFGEALESFQAARRLTAQTSADLAPTFRCLVAEAYTLHYLHRTHEAIRLLEQHRREFERFEQEFTEVLGELYEKLGSHAKAHALYSEAVLRLPQNSVLHYRLARTSVSLGRTGAGARHLTTATTMDSKFVTMAVEEPVFQKLWYSIKLNRVLNFRLLQLKSRYVSLVLLSLVLILVVLMMWKTNPAA